MKRFAAALTVTTTVLAFAPVPLTAQARQPQVQQAAPQTVPAPGVNNPYAAANVSAENIKQSFQEVLQRYPRSVPRILRLDPRLMNDPSYMANYPAIQQFIAQFPDVARNPEYYLSDYAYGYYEVERNRDPRDRAFEMIRSWVEMFMVFLIAVTVSIAVLWLLKSLIDHRRWLRVSKIQTEVHTKLLDRFGTSEELLNYMRTPAGARFLESTPIALDGPARTSIAAPVNRILWSVQAGIVIFLGGAAFLVARNWFEGQDFDEVRTMLAMIGTFSCFIGIGFIVSAVVAWVLSQRFGLMDGTRSGGHSSVAQ